MRIYEAVQCGDRWFIQGLYKECSPILVFWPFIQIKEARRQYGLQFERLM